MNFLRASHTGAIFQYEASLASLASDVTKANCTSKVDELARTTVVFASSRHQEVVGSAGGTGGGTLTGAAAGRTGHAATKIVAVLAGRAGLGGHESCHCG